ncbi:biotin/lipoyl-binding protein [Halosquirtibacter xylanolyticus]|uniref:efflux RND transporter periplasmic adaptor subunit n=1 Tax=Halosquirtibacter xylanolyticus TaxID=3374599 RepID=UPI0037485B1C|nr:biotin/lipoyl-binding protein [Prolixibacteraceae bacterium]
MNRYYFVSLLSLIYLLSSCTEAKKEKSSEKEAITTTAIQVVNYRQGVIPSITPIISNSKYLKRENLKTPIAGYVSEVNIHLGAYVKRGDVLYKIKQLESSVLDEKTKKRLGYSVEDYIVRSPFNGVVSNFVVSEPGGYIAMGTLLCGITKTTSLRFLTEVPFNILSDIGPKSVLRVVMPNGERTRVVVESILPIANAVTQNITYVTKPVKALYVPEGIRLVTEIVNQRDSSVLILPKSAVQSSDDLTKSWIFTVDVDYTVTKHEVQLGRRDSKDVEIISPIFNKEARFVTVGSYGLEGGKRVRITNQ